MNSKSYNVIFTDGAITKNSIGTTRVSCGAASILNINDKNEVKISANAVKINEYYNTTNNEAELFGILKGIELITDNTNEYILYSDSEYAINSLTKWIIDWYKTYTQSKNKNGIVLPSMLTKGGKPVKNCILICAIINLIVKKNVRICFRHVRGHMSENKNEDIITQAKYMAKVNNMPYEKAISEAKFVCKYNNFIDNFAKNYINKYIKGEFNDEIENQENNAYIEYVEYGIIEFSKIDMINNREVITDIDINNDAEFQFDSYVYKNYLLNKAIMQKYLTLIKY